MKGMMCADKGSGLQLAGLVVPFSEIRIIELSMVMLTLGASSCLTLHDFPGQSHLLP